MWRESGPVLPMAHRNRMANEKLTIDHLQDSVVAHHVRHLVPHVRHVAIVQHSLQLGPGLVYLVLAARRVYVVPGVVKGEAGRAERSWSREMENIYIDTRMFSS